MKKYLHKPSLYIALLAIVLLIIVFMGSSLRKRDIKSNKSDNEEIIAQPSTNENFVKSEEIENVSMPLYGQWKTFTKNDGLPSNKVNCVKIDKDRVLIGTDEGLVIYKDGNWQHYTPQDGLAHRNVLSIDVNEATGDVWIATMSGLNRWSAGIFERFDQFNSGLANDVVYQVDCDERYTWVATGAGASRYDTYTNQWRIFNEQNSPMHEPWTYGVCIGDDKTYIAAWGGGVIEYNSKTDHFRDYRDPDGEMEIDLFPDDGLVHDITTNVSYDNGILWVATYFGMNKYNGKRWWGYFDHDSGLSSNFINFLKGKNSIVYVCTDNGLNTFDGTTWVTYNTIEGSPNGETTITQGSFIKNITTNSSVAHRFIWGIDVKDDVIWVATSHGLSTAKVIGKVADHTPKM